mmetsp:Transcript_50249/g.92322  ORF Transcript_50249/g.92322 Transcript_50249/m.92322 type:complete len:259 (+) Transcript_50249:668-1444(+)
MTTAIPFRSSCLPSMLDKLCVLCRARLPDLMSLCSPLSSRTLQRPDSATHCSHCPGLPFSSAAPVRPYIITATPGCRIGCGSCCDSLLSCCLPALLASAFGAAPEPLAASCDAWPASASLCASPFVLPCASLCASLCDSPWALSCAWLSFFLLALPTDMLNLVCFSSWWRFKERSRSSNTSTFCKIAFRTSWGRGRLSDWWVFTPELARSSSRSSTGRITKMVDSSRLSVISVHFSIMGSSIRDSFCANACARFAGKV